jgi:hypothetical protein
MAQSPRREEKQFHLGNVQSSLKEVGIGNARIVERKRQHAVFV